MEALTLVDQIQVLPILQDALRRRVCAVCVDRNLNGACELEARHECKLFESLPQIARTVSRVHSDNIDDYVSAIRGNICMACHHQDTAGECMLRNEARCALDRYLEPIVESIEEVRDVVLKSGRLLA